MPEGPERPRSLFVTRFRLVGPGGGSSSKEMSDEFPVAILSVRQFGTGDDPDQAINPGCQVRAVVNDHCRCGVPGEGLGN